MPISSLPSNYGIGTLGKQAYKFVDFLYEANQSYWQVLPIGHTGYGDSPYQCFSSFAGNPYFIDLDLLVEDKLLNKRDIKNLKNSDFIDYGYLYETRYQILHKAYLIGIHKYKKEFNQFVKENKDWLKDYALFISIKKYYNNISWQEWPDISIKVRKKEAINKYSKLLKDDVLFYEFIQFLFFKQYSKLKSYANKHGIKIIGDVPIYVALDSSDVWSSSEQFLLNKKTKAPKVVAGCSPDYFNDNGQLWGNPIYDWDYMKKQNYRWWVNRLNHASKFFDVIRIDHFIGFARFWAVPAKDSIAKYGRFMKGPSINFINVVKKKLKHIDFIAEDLGLLNDDCIRLLKDSGFPGMRVLVFAMSDDGTSYHSPHNHIENCVCYTSTHDSEPVMGFVKNANKKDLTYAKKCFGLNKEEGYNFGFIRVGMASVAKLFICPIQDYLGLDDKATINHPGTLGNWTWRLNRNVLNKKLAKKIASMTHAYARDRY